MKTDRFALVALSACILVAGTLSGQGRGRRGPPPEVRERWGNYFTTVKLEMDGTGDRLQATDHVTDAAADGHLALLYVFDSADNPKKRQGFEQALFNNNKINPGLRLFRCGLIDIAGTAAARQKYGKQAPLLVVYDKKGKETAKVSMKGYHAVPVKLVQAMRRGAAGYAKLSFDGWIKKYGKFVHEIGLLKGREKTVEGQRKRLEDRAKPSDRKKLDKLIKKHNAMIKETEKHFAKEDKLLELAKVPPRDPGAKLVGEPRRGRR